MRRGLTGLRANRRLSLSPCPLVPLSPCPDDTASNPRRRQKMPLPTSPGATKTLLPQPCVLVIFGGDGDLAWRKLLPAVYNLNKDGALPSHFAVVCFGIASTGQG